MTITIFGEAGKKKTASASGSKRKASAKKSSTKHAKKPAAAAGGSHKKKRNTNSYRTYIYKVLAQVHPDLGLSKRGLAEIDNSCKDLFERLASRAGQLASYAGKKTITSDTFKSAVALEFSGEMIKNAQREGKERLDNYMANGGGSKANKMSKSERAKLQFSVGRVTRQLKNARKAPRLSQGAGVYLTAVLEYAVAELLELSGNLTREWKKVQITGRHITLAVNSDEELNSLFKTGTFAHGGVTPFIHEMLLPKKRAPSAKQEKKPVVKAEKKKPASAKKKKKTSASKKKKKPASASKKKKTSASAKKNQVTKLAQQIDNDAKQIVKLES